MGFSELVEEVRTLASLQAGEFKWLFVLEVLKNLLKLFTGFHRAKFFLLFFLILVFILFDDCEYLAVFRGVVF